ncbi:hypothetical protein EV13_2919 [Prochlorococcus sp. MIT 0702]|nr:hypothetical protein EV12_2865 [Prochlorococcus sp. MIT 0701]KGG26138.1 hypothetical protein EV13_2919 [Prochlorococcus sp. MIT 0702]KGG32962.1 hypothetical protein EV14_1803 [Prochlorococcus sp. MIT 0703]
MKDQSEQELQRRDKQKLISVLGDERSKSLPERIQPRH